MIFCLVCYCMFVAGPVVRRLYTALLGYPAVMSCGRDPVEPVRWTFQHSPDSAVKNISNSHRFRLRGSSLIIYDVEAGDVGTYNCTDSTGELRAFQLTVIGKVYVLLS